MGRPKMSEAQKKLRGTYNSTLDGKPKIDMFPLLEMPEPPKDSSEHEKEFFRRVAGALFESGTLREVDVMQIEMNALWWHVYKENRQLVIDRSVQITSTGWQQITGAVTAVEKACKILQSFSDRYGLNLISKDKIAAPMKKENEIDNILNGSA